jgi:hypothetical protein
VSIDVKGRWWVMNWLGGSNLLKSPKLFNKILADMPALLDFLEG